MKVLLDNGYKQGTEASRFVKEWDAQINNRRTDTSIGIAYEDGKIYRAWFLTDKFASKTGSYYTGKIVFPEPKECTPELLEKIEHCIARVSVGSFKELKEQFKTEPMFHKMS